MLNLAVHLIVREIPFNMAKDKEMLLALSYCFRFCSAQTAFCTPALHKHGPLPSPQTNHSRPVALL